jgi:hypothetical protein
LHKEVLSDLGSLPYVIRLIKSGRTRWAVKKNPLQGFSAETLDVLGVDGSIILKWVLTKLDWIDEAQNRDRAVVSRVMKLWLP